jgi:hypothetical protein
MIAVRIAVSRRHQRSSVPVTRRCTGGGDGGTGAVRGGSRTVTAPTPEAAAGQPRPQPLHQIGPQAGDQQDADDDQDGAADPGHRARVPAQEGRRAHRPARPEGHEHERDAQPQAVGDPEERAPPCGGLRVGEGVDRGQRRPEARRPAQPEHHAEQRRPGQAGDRPRRDPRGALQERQPAEERQAQNDRDDAEHPVEQVRPLEQQPAEAAERRAERDEDQREPEHEQHGAGEHPPPRRALVGLGAHRGRRPPGPADGGGRRRTGARADQAGDVGEVAGHERQHARRGEADQPHERRHPGGDEQRAVGDQAAEGLAHLSPP